MATGQPQNRHEPLHSFHSEIRAEGVMPLIWVIVVLSFLRFFEIGWFQNLSWWWIAGLFLIAFIWFEFIERMFGLDKRKAAEQLEKARQNRVKKTFQK